MTPPRSRGAVCLALAGMALLWPARAEAVDAAAKLPANDEVAFCGKHWKRGTESLQCKDASVPDLAPLASLKYLARLDLSGSGVADLSPLAKHEWLIELKLNDTRVADRMGDRVRRPRQRLLVGQRRALSPVRYSQRYASPKTWR